LKKRQSQIREEVLNQIKEQKKLKQSQQVSTSIEESIQGARGQSEAATLPTALLPPSPPPTIHTSGLVHEDSFALVLNDSQQSLIQTAVYSGMKVLQIKAPSGVMIMRRCADGLVNLEQCLEASGLPRSKRESILLGTEVDQRNREVNLPPTSNSESIGKVWVSPVIVERLANEVGFWDGFGVKELCQAQLPTSQDFSVGSVVPSSPSSPKLRTHRIIAISNLGNDSEEAEVLGCMFSEKLDGPGKSVSLAPSPSLSSSSSSSSSSVLSALPDSQPSITSASVQANSTPSTSKLPMKLVPTASAFRPFDTVWVPVQLALNSAPSLDTDSLDSDAIEELDRILDGGVLYWPSVITDVTVASDRIAPSVTSTTITENMVTGFHKLPDSGNIASAEAVMDVSGDLESTRKVWKTPIQITATGSRISVGTSLIEVMDTFPPHFLNYQHDGRSKVNHKLQFPSDQAFYINSSNSTTTPERLWCKTHPYMYHIRLIGISSLTPSIPLRVDDILPFCKGVDHLPSILKSADGMSWVLRYMGMVGAEGMRKDSGLGDRFSPVGNSGDGERDFEVLGVDGRHEPVSNAADAVLKSFFKAALLCTAGTEGFHANEMLQKSTERVVKVVLAAQSQFMLAESGSTAHDNRLIPCQSIKIGSDAIYPNDVVAVLYRSSSSLNQSPTTGCNNISWFKIRRMNLVRSPSSSTSSALENLHLEIHGLPVILPNSDKQRMLPWHPNPSGLFESKSTQNNFSIPYTNHQPTANGRAVAGDFIESESSISPADVICRWQPWMSFTKMEELESKLLKLAGNIEVDGGDVDAATGGLVIDLVRDMHGFGVRELKT
jgi:hypothetical protein